MSKIKEGYSHETGKWEVISDETKLESKQKSK